MRAGIQIHFPLYFSGRFNFVVFVPFVDRFFRNIRENIEKNTTTLWTN